MRQFATIVTTAAVMLAAQSAFAQRAAGSKAAGEYSFYGQAAARSMQGAREYARDYQQYAQTVQTVNPEVAKEAADSIGEYITKAQAHMASMRKQADATNDKPTLASLDMIDKNLATAKKSHADMLKTCSMKTVDKKESMACCKVIDEPLAKAIAEHDKLMKQHHTPVAKK